MGRTKRAPGRRGLALMAIALASLASPAVASAHLRSGTVAVDYQASIRHPVSVADTVRIFQSDRALGISVRPGHTLELLGYLGEPVFRLDDAGLWANEASPTAAAERLVPRAALPAGSALQWRLLRRTHSIVWQDARVRGLPAGVTRGAWSVPLIVDGRRARLEGELHRFPRPILWPWLVALAAIPAAAALLLARGRAEHVRAAAIALALVCVLAATVLSIAFALDPYASPGTWIESGDGIAFMAVGVGIILRGPRDWHVGAAIGLGLLGLGLGISKGDVFLHPIALAILPATVMRYAGITAMGAGSGCALLGCWIYARAPDRVYERHPGASGELA